MTGVQTCASSDLIRPYGEEKATGIFFSEQTAESLIKAVHQFDAIKDSILAQDCRENALKFSAQRFHNELDEYIQNKWHDFNERKRIVY